MIKLPATLVPPEYIEKINVLINARVFDLDSGKVELNFHNGQIQNIVINKVLYKRKKNEV